MLRLFQIEWMKIKTYRTFWLLFVGFLVTFPLTLYFFATKFNEGSGNQQEELLKSLMGNPFSFPRAWLSSAYFGGLFFVMIGMLFILLITNEVQYRTHRQNIIDGWSRMDFLAAKFTMLVFFVLVSTALVFISGFWIGSMYPAEGTSYRDGLHYVGYFALMATIYLAVASVIAILVKRTGLSIIIYFGIVCIADNLLWLMLTKNNSQAGYFLPLETGDSLLPNPFKPKAMEKRTLADSTLVMAAIAYIALFGFLIRNYFQRTDLKT